MPRLQYFGMESVSRRGALRLLGAGAAGIAVTTGAGPLSAALAGPRPRVLRNLGPKVVIPSGTILVGMSAPAELWKSRVRAVGPGLGARRIFADLADGPNTQIKLVEQAHAAGMLPVISYKVGNDAAGAAAGRFDKVAERAAARLASYRRSTAVTFWHEPYGDMDGELYAAASQRLLPIFKRGRLKVGPLLNGWLLDSKVSDFAEYCPDELFELWDWFGIDTYESGTFDRPGKSKPADRIIALGEYLRSRGYGDIPLGVGEYNGYSAETIEAVGEALFTTPNVWFGCLWNTTGGKGMEVTGDRLKAFKQTLADPRRARTAPKSLVDDVLP